jgi:hypothetical protein
MAMPMAKGSLLRASIDDSLFVIAIKEVVYISLTFWLTAFFVIVAASRLRFNLKESRKKRRAGAE